MGTNKIIWGQVIRKALHCKHWPRGVQMSKFTAAELYKSTETWEQSQIQASCLLLFKANGLRAMHLRLWASPCEEYVGEKKGQCNILALWQTCLNNMKKLVKWVYIQNHNIWHRLPQTTVSYIACINLYPNIRASFTSILQNLCYLLYAHENNIYTVCIHWWRTTYIPLWKKYA